MINKGKMLTGKLRYILGIALIIILLGLVVGGKLFFKTKTEKSPTFKVSEVVGTIQSLGKEDEFSLEKDGEIVFQNKAEDEPKIKYRISYPGKTVSAKWGDLKLGDKIVLTISYDPEGQTESRILKIYRNEERPIELY